MELVFRYFWFIGAAFMLVNLVIWRRRLVTLIDRGVVTKQEVDAFIRWCGEATVPTFSRGLGPR